MQIVPQVFKNTARIRQNTPFEEKNHFSCEAAALSNQAFYNRLCIPQNSNRIYDTTAKVATRK